MRTQGENSRDRDAAGDEAASRSVWPPVGFEKRQWHSDPQLRQVVSRNQLRRHSGEYLAAVPGVIAHRGVGHVDSPLMAELGDATAELRAFDVATGHLAAPFAAILLRTESASSSQIEQLTASAKSLALAELGEPSSQNARLVVRNVRALEAAIELSDAVGHEQIISMHAELLRESAPGMVGRYRIEQVWIGRGIGPHTAEFVAPHHERVGAAMDDLLEFVRRTDLPELAQIAIAHAQFETIHPFPDGNGRTGRALVQSMLRNTGITQNVTVPLSAGLLTDTRGYFDALTRYREGDIEPILRVFAASAFDTVRNGSQLVREMEEIRERWEQALRGVRSDSVMHPLSRLLLSNPAVNVTAVVERFGVSPRTALTAVDGLVERGIVVPTTQNRRNRTWAASEVLAALDAFAARIGRSRT